MKLLKLLSVKVLVLIFVAAGVVAKEPPARFDFVRPLGMGGAFTAVADDHNIFNFNPAGMVQRTGGTLTILEVAGGVSEGTLDAIDFVSDHENELDNYENLTYAQQVQLTNEIIDNITTTDPRLFVAADIASYVSGPHFFGLPVHVGFGAFGIMDSSFRVDIPMGDPEFSFRVNNDLVFPVAVAKRWEAPWIIPGRIGLGVQGKAIRRFQVDQRNKSLLELDDVESPPVADGQGIGADLGLLYQPTSRLNLGMMVRDFGGTKISYDAADLKKGYDPLPERDTVIRPRTNVGVAYVPKTLLFLLPTTDRWTFAFDVRDIFVDNEHLFFTKGFHKPFGENLPTHLYMGAEYRYWFLRFRGGAYQGYPSFGLGVDIPFIKLDYAYYSRELPPEMYPNYSENLVPKAGDRRQGNHVISLAIRFGSGSVEARERIRDAKKAKKQRGMATPEALPAAEPTPEPAVAEPEPEAQPAPAESEGGADEIPE